MLDVYDRYDSQTFQIAAEAQGVVPHYTYTYLIFLTVDIDWSSPRFPPVSEEAGVGTPVGAIMAAAVNQTIVYSIIEGNEGGERAILCTAVAISCGAGWWWMGFLMSLNYTQCLELGSVEQFSSNAANFVVAKLDLRLWIGSWRNRSHASCVCFSFVIYWLGIESLSCPCQHPRVYYFSGYNITFVHSQLFMNIVLYMSACLLIFMFWFF